MGATLTDPAWADKPLFGWVQPAHARPHRQHPEPGSLGPAWRRGDPTGPGAPDCV